MKVNLDSNSWRTFDAESVTNTEGGVQHGASIVQDLRAIVEDGEHVFFPDRAIATAIVLGKNNGGAGAIVLGVLIGLLEDALEIAGFALMVAKHLLLDIPAHAGAFVVNKLRGESDGNASQVETFDYNDSSSIVRLLWGRDRRSRLTGVDIRPLFDLKTAEEHFARLHGTGSREVRPERMNNFNDMVAWKPLAAYRPGPAIDDTAAVMRDIQAKIKSGKLPKDVMIKAGGAGHSFGANATNGVYIYPQGMAFFDTMPPKGSSKDTLRADVADREGLATVGAGSTIRETNLKLWQLGRSIPTLGGYDRQTMGGGIPTGTHGCVLGQGPLHDLVRSMDMVRVDGSKVRIEPKNGITDLKKFKREHPDMELIQADDVFSAALVTCGTLGVVYSYTLATVPKFYLHEHHSNTTTDEIRATLANENLYNLADNDGNPNGEKTKRAFFPNQPGDPAYDARSKGPHKAYTFCFMFNPHSHKAQVSTSVKTDLPVEPFDLGRRVDKQMLNDAERKVFARPVLSTWLLGDLPKVVGSALNALDGLFPGSIPALVDAAVDGDYDYINRGYNVFFSGDDTADVPSRFGSFQVPIKGDKYLEAIEVLQDAAQEWAALHGQYQTGPINCRPSKRTNALLGRDEDVMNFECLFPGAPDYTGDMLNFYRDRLAKKFGYDVTMHFGQEAPNVTGEAVSRQYKGYDKFNEIRQQFDPDGHMLNGVQKNLFPTKRAPIKREVGRS